MEASASINDAHGFPPECGCYFLRSSIDDLALGFPASFGSRFAKPPRRLKRPYSTTPVSRDDRRQRGVYMLLDEATNYFVNFRKAKAEAVVFQCNHRLYGF